MLLIEWWFRYVYTYTVIHIYIHVVMWIYSDMHRRKVISVRGGRYDGATDSKDDSEVVMQTVAVCNQKGGVCKTTTVAAVAS